MLYHVTKRENVNSILRNGLIPQIGKSSAMINETHNFTYLCRHEDIPYWMILTESNSAVCVDVSGMTMTCREYGLYNEYVCSQAIPSYRISQCTDFTHPDESHWYDIVYLYTLNICMACDSIIVNDLTGNISPTYEMTEDMAPYIDRILDRIRVYEFPREVLINIMRKISLEGYTTFLDIMNDGRRLYQAVLDNAVVGVNSMRINIYNTIIKQYHGILDTDTGEYGMRVE